LLEQPVIIVDILGSKVFQVLFEITVVHELEDEIRWVLS
jgi:hypothetical protein